MRSKRVSKIDFRETRIQNLFETSIQGEFPNEYPKCVPGRYVFWGWVLQNAFLGYSGASAAYPLALRGDLVAELSKMWQAKVSHKEHVSKAFYVVVWRKRLARGGGFYIDMKGFSLKVEAGAALGCTRGVRGHTRRVYDELYAGYPRPWWNHSFHWPSEKNTPLKKVYAKGIRGIFEIGIF